MRLLQAAIRAPTNTVREMPRRISPPTIRGELNMPLIDILHACSYGLLNTWRLDIVPATRARIQTSPDLAGKNEGPERDCHMNLAPAERESKGSALVQAAVAARQF
jgi:hypothetical protein